MPFKTLSRAYHLKANNFYLYTGFPTYKGVPITPVENLIIIAKSGIILEENQHANNMFHLQYGFRLSFYCPHGTKLMSYPNAPDAPDAPAPSPVPLMRGDYEAYETITAGQPCYSYTLCPESLHESGKWKGDFAKMYIGIIDNNRTEREKSKSKKDKYPAHNYDLLVPDAQVSLRRLLQEVKKRYPQYFHFHCLFSRSEEFAGEVYEPWTLPSRFYQGDLGRWEKLDKPPDAGASTSSAGTSNAGFKDVSINGRTWLFLEMSCMDYGTISKK